MSWVSSSISRRSHVDHILSIAVLIAMLGTFCIPGPSVVFAHTSQSIPGVHEDIQLPANRSSLNTPVEQTVEMVKDLAPGDASSDPTQLTNANGFLYFLVDNYLWKSDGTEAETFKVIDAAGVGGQPSFSDPYQLTEVSGKLYFVARGINPPSWEDIWVTDGTPSGTRRLYLTSTYGSLSELTQVNGGLSFVWRDCGPGSSLCDILMNLNGEILRETVAPHPHIPAYSSLTNVNGTLFFVHADYRGTPGDPPTPPKLYWQLMKANGTDGESIVVGDIPGDEVNPPREFTDVNGTLYFVANDGINGWKLWRSDGTTIEMVPSVSGTVPQIGSIHNNPQELTNVAGNLYFVGGNSAPKELWTVDDTGNAKGVFCYFLTTSCFGSLGQLTNVDGTLYFVHSWENGTTLFRHDSNGTSGVKVFPVRTPPPFVPILSHLTNVNGTLFFSADDGINGAELWKSDGTEGSTTMVADIALGSASSDSSELTNVNGTLFFAANDGVHGNELWQTVVSTPPPSHLTVTSNADSGPGSLRWAIASLASGGTIDFAFTQPTTITLTSRELVIDKAMTINGPGAEILTIRTAATGQSGDYSRVFNTSGNEVYLNGVTIRDGKQPAGGAGILNSGSLMLTQCELINNFATGATGPGGPGGAILNTENGTLSIVNCIITGNRAAGGAGIYNSGSLKIQKGFDGNIISGHSEVTHNGAATGGGGIFNQGNADIAFMTLSNNSGSQAGGGILNSGTLEMGSSELIDNSAFAGGGISNSNSMSLHFVVFTRNHAVSAGGGIDNSGYADVNSLFTENDADSRGGAIRNSEQGTMSIVASFQDNNAVYGGALYNQGALTVITTSFLGNEARIAGGGVYNEGQVDIGWKCTLNSNSSQVGGAIYNKGTLTIDTSSVEHNSATQDGGGIYNDGTLKISGWVWHNTVGGKKINASVSDNTAGGSGGGIINSKNGTVEIKIGLISDNSATERGGGIYNLGGTVTINDSTLFLNTANAGGGVYNENGTVVLNQATISSNTAQVVGGILQESGELIVNNSSINNNVATQFFVTGGGGIRNGPASILTITNSTISNNTTNNLGGSGIENFGTLTLNNATITGNSGSPDSPGFRNLGTASLRNSLIAGNVGPSVIGQDCDGTLNSQGYNLIQDTTRCIIIGDTTGNLLGVDPLLGPLKDNGGPTFTHALLPGSPAINAIDRGVCPPPDTDQRRVSRPQGQKCDIGAYEALNSPPTASANGPYTADEGSIVTLDATSSTDPDGDPLTFEWDLNNDGEFDDAAGVIVTTSFPDDGQYPVAVRVTDTTGAQSTDSAMVNVLNVAPAIPGAINTTGKPALINTNLEFSAAFTDPGILDTHTALWDWGDGSTTSPGLVSSYNVTGSHSYNKAGLYTVTLSIADDDGASAAKSYQYVVVVDPKAGFVTGGGWFRYSNKIGQFGFVAHYLPRDTNAPVGSVVFQVPSSRFVFSSTQFNWLVIDGSKATIRGAGKINGKGSYQFLLTITDGSPDSIRIKIWEQATGLVFYDTQPGASDTADPTLSIKGGSIRIHKPK